MSAGKKRAYFTLVENDPWVIGALVLGHSLRKSQTTATLICQVGPDVSHESRRRIGEVYDAVELAQEYQFPESKFNRCQDIPERLAFSFRRLNAWNRTEFERITYMDSDLVVINNIDALFNVPGVAAPREFDFKVWMRGKTFTDFFNGGLVSFTPSEAVFAQFAETLAAQWVYLGASEQHLVNVVCRNDWFRIPDRYHVQAGTLHHAEYSVQPVHMRTLHFSKISKPWDKSYSGRKSLWLSWRRFACIWAEWLRGYEVEYADTVCTGAFWWEGAAAGDRRQGSKDEDTDGVRKPSSVRRSKRIHATPTKLAEIAVFMGAFQKINELKRLIALLRRRKLRTLVEIGTFRGGTLWLWCQLATESARVVSIDLPAKSYSGWMQQDKMKAYVTALQRLDFIRGDSRRKSTLSRLEQVLDGAPIDFLFIDGDHNYDSVRQDFERYSALVRPGGIVALHDILYHPGFPENQVNRYWQEIKEKFRVRELVEPEDERGWGQWGGIGVVYMS